MNFLFLSISIVTCLVQICNALYGSRTDVVLVNDEKTFNTEVMKHAGIALVEFYAPWCGHCKSLAPEWEKAATLLKGIVKVVAVDATAAESLAQKYQIQGFPTIKVFGNNKKSPTDFQGQRTSDAIVSEAMKSVNSLVKERKGGKQSGSSKSSGSSGGSKGSNKGGSKSAVVELTDVNFQALVMESQDHWLVEFFAPWCGHCKNLAPEWESAATQLKGQVKLGAVDATVHTSLAQKYGVKGYPTIKMFPAGKKGKAKDYNGPREAAGIVEHALRTLDEAGVPPSTPQLTSSAVLESSCGASGKICVIMFVPHILDSGAKGRNGYLDTLTDLAKTFRGQPYSFVWSEGGTQSDIENQIGVNFYPTVAVVSTEKKLFAVMRISWNLKNIKAFLNGVLSGSEQRGKLSGDLAKVVKVKDWDGKDGEPIKDEISLDELMKD